MAGRYEHEFVDPYRRARRNPLLDQLDAIDGAHQMTVADLGCGIGPLLPALADRFRRVVAVDFAAGMLDRARERCGGYRNVEFLQRDLGDLDDLEGSLDVVCAINSLVMPKVGKIEHVLSQIKAALRPGGLLLGIVPAMDAIHYQTMLLVDRARETGMPEDKARRNAAQHAEHGLYDFAFADFRYVGLEQHFWQPFEIAYRLGRAGFRDVQKGRVELDWDQFACAGDLRDLPAPWDWFFRAVA